MHKHCHNCNKELWHFIIRDGKPYCNEGCVEQMSKKIEYKKTSDKITIIRSKYKPNESPSYNDCWFYHQYSVALDKFVRENPSFWSGYHI